MAEADFYLKFGSNAKDFARILNEDLAGARQVISNFRDELASIGLSSEQGGGGAAGVDVLGNLRKTIRREVDDLGDSIENLMGAADDAVEGFTTAARRPGQAPRAGRPVGTGSAIGGGEEEPVATRSGLDVSGSLGTLDAAIGGTVDALTGIAGRLGPILEGFESFSDNVLKLNRRLAAQETALARGEPPQGRTLGGRFDVKGAPDQTEGGRKAAAESALRETAKVQAQETAKAGERALQAVASTIVSQLPPPPGATAPSATERVADSAQVEAYLLRIMTATERTATMLSQGINLANAPTGLSEQPAARISTPEVATPQAAAQLTEAATQALKETPVEITVDPTKLTEAVRPQPTIETATVPPDITTDLSEALGSALQAQNISVTAEQMADLMRVAMESAQAAIAGKTEPSIDVDVKVDEATGAAEAETTTTTRSGRRMSARARQTARRLGRLRGRAQRMGPLEIEQELAEATQEITRLQPEIDALEKQMEQYVAEAKKANKRAQPKNRQEYKDMQKSLTALRRRLRDATEAQSAIEEETRRRTADVGVLDAVATQLREIEQGEEFKTWRKTQLRAAIETMAQEGFQLDPQRAGVTRQGTVGANATAEQMRELLMEQRERYMASGRQTLSGMGVANITQGFTPESSPEFRQAMQELGRRLTDTATEEIARGALREVRRYGVDVTPADPRIRNLPDAKQGSYFQVDPVRLQGERSGAAGYTGAQIEEFIDTLAAAPMRYQQEAQRIAGQLLSQNIAFDPYKEATQGLAGRDQRSTGATRFNARMLMEAVEGLDALGRASIRVDDELAHIVRAMEAIRERGPRKDFDDAAEMVGLQERYDQILAEAGQNIPDWVTELYSRPGAREALAAREESRENFAVLDAGERQRRLETTETWQAVERGLMQSLFGRGAGGAALMENIASRRGAMAQGISEGDREKFAAVMKSAIGATFRSVAAEAMVGAAPEEQRAELQARQAELAQKAEQALSRLYGMYNRLMGGTQPGFRQVEVETAEGETRQMWTTSRALLEATFQQQEAVARSQHQAIREAEKQFIQPVDDPAQFNDATRRLAAASEDLQRAAGRLGEAAGSPQDIVARAQNLAELRGVRLDQGRQADTTPTMEVPEGGFSRRENEAYLAQVLGRGVATGQALEADPVGAFRQAIEPMVRVIERASRFDQLSAQQQGRVLSDLARLVGTPYGTKEERAAVREGGIEPLLQQLNATLRAQATAAAEAARPLEARRELEALPEKDLRQRLRRDFDLIGDDMRRALSALKGTEFQPRQVAAPQETLDAMVARLQPLFERASQYAEMTSRQQARLIADLAKATDTAFETPAEKKSVREAGPEPMLQALRDQVAQRVDVEKQVTSANNAMQRQIRAEQEKALRTWLAEHVGITKRQIQLMARARQLIEQGIDEGRKTFGTRYGLGREAGYDTSSKQVRAELRDMDMGTLLAQAEAKIRQGGVTALERERMRHPVQPAEREAAAAAPEATAQAVGGAVTEGLNAIIGKFISDVRAGQADAAAQVGESVAQAVRPVVESASQRDDMVAQLLRQWLPQGQRVEEAEAKPAPEPQVEESPHQRLQALVAQLLEKRDLPPEPKRYGDKQREEVTKKLTETADPWMQLATPKPNQFTGAKVHIFGETVEDTVEILERLNAVVRNLGLGAKVATEGMKGAIDLEEGFGRAGGDPNYQSTQRGKQATVYFPRMETLLDDLLAVLNAMRGYGKTGVAGSTDIPLTPAVGFRYEFGETQAKPLGPQEYKQAYVPADVDTTAAAAPMIQRLIQELTQRLGPAVGDATNQAAQKATATLTEGMTRGQMRYALAQMPQEQLVDMAKRAGVQEQRKPLEDLSVHTLARKLVDAAVGQATALAPPQAAPTAPTREPAAAPEDVVQALAGQARQAAAVGDKAGFDACCDRMVAAINGVREKTEAVITALKGTLKVAGKVETTARTKATKAQAEAAEEEPAAPKTRKSADGINDKMPIRFRMTGEQLSEAMENLPDDVRQVVNQEEALLAVATLVEQKLRSQADAVRLVVAAQDLNLKQAKEVEAAISAYISHRRGMRQQDEEMSRRAREAPKASAKQFTQAGTDEAAAMRLERAEAYLTDAAKEQIEVLKRLYREKASQREINEALARSYAAVATDMYAGSRRPGETPMDTRTVKAATSEYIGAQLELGDNLSTQWLDMLTRSAGIDMKQEFLDATEETVFGMRAIFLKLFGTSGFLGRLVASAGTFMIRQLSAGFVFGLTNQLQMLVQNALQAEATFVRVSDALEATGRSSEGLRGNLQDISMEMGIPLTEVYDSAAQLAGVFQDVGQVEFATRVVAQLELISDGALTTQEGITALASVATAFGLQGTEGLQRIGDVVTNIQNRIGTNIEVTLEGIGALSAQAQQLGFTMEETSVYVSQIAKLTNQTGPAAGEQLGRMFAAMGGGRARGAITRALDARGIDVQGAIAARDYATVMRVLIENYNGLTRAQQDQIAGALGGQRQARSTQALLSRGTDLITELTAAELAYGEMNERTASRLNTFDTQLRRAGQAIQAFVQNLLDMGILEGAEQGLRAFSVVLGGFVDIMQKINAIAETNPITRWARNWVVNLAIVAVAIKGIRIAFRSFLDLFGPSGQIGTILEAARGMGGGIPGQGPDQPPSRSRVREWAEMRSGVNAQGEPVYGGPQPRQRVPLAQDQIRGPFGRTTHWIGRGVEQIGRAGEQFGRLNHTLFNANGNLANANRLGGRFSSVMRGMGTASGWVGRQFTSLGQAIQRVGASALASTIRANLAALAFGGLVAIIANEYAQMVQFRDKLNQAFAKRLEPEAPDEGAQQEGATGIPIANPARVLVEEHQKTMETTFGAWAENMKAGAAQLSNWVLDYVDSLTGAGGALAERVDIDFRFASPDARMGILSREQQQVAQDLQDSAAEGLRQQFDSAEDARESGQKQLDEVIQYMRDVQGDPNMSDQQKAQALSWAENLYQNIMKSIQTAALLAANLNAANNISIDQLQSLSEIFNIYQQVPAGVVSEFSDTMELLEQGAGLDPDSTYAQIMGQLKGGDVSQVGVLQAHADALHDWLEIQAEVIPTLPEGTDDRLAQEREFAQRLIEYGQLRKSLADMIISQSTEYANFLRMQGDYAGADREMFASIAELRKQRDELAPSDVRGKAAFDMRIMQTRAEGVTANVTAQYAQQFADMAGGYSSAARANLELEAAEAALAALEAAGGAAVVGRDAIIAAQTRVNEARRQVSDESEALTAAIAQSAISGVEDPYQRALLEQEEAYRVKAEQWGRSSVLNEQLNQRVTAANLAAAAALRDREIAGLELELAEIAPGDVLSQARKRQQIAQVKQTQASRLGTDSAEYKRATADAIAAQRELDQVMNDMLMAQSDFAIALAEYAGLHEEVANLGLKAAEDALAFALQRSGGAESPDVVRARAAKVQAQGQVRDTWLSERTGDIEYMLEMEQISKRAAISMYQSILAQADQRELTRDQIRDLNLRIKRLTDDINSEHAGMWNFGDIKLPTPYEVRRMMGLDEIGEATYEAYQDVVELRAAASTRTATASAGGMGTSFGTGISSTSTTMSYDQSQSQIVINIDGADTAKVRQIIEETLGAPAQTRTTSTGRRY